MQHLLCNVEVFRASITDTEDFYDKLLHVEVDHVARNLDISCTCREIQVTEKERSEVLWETALFGLIRVHSI